MSMYDRELDGCIAAFSSPASVEALIDRIEDQLGETLPDFAARSIRLNLHKRYSHISLALVFVVALEVFPDEREFVKKAVDLDLEFKMEGRAIRPLLGSVHEDLAIAVAKLIQRKLHTSGMTFTEYYDMYGRDRIAAALKKESYAGGGYAPSPYDPYTYKTRETTFEREYRPMRDLPDLEKLKEEYGSKREGLRKAAEMAEAMSTATDAMLKGSEKMSETAKAISDLKGKLEGMEEEKKERGPFDKRFTSMTTTEAAELLVAAIKEVNLRLALESDGKGFKVGCDTVIEGYDLDEGDKLIDVGFIRPHGGFLAIDIQGDDGPILPLRLKDLPDVLPEYWQIVQDELEYGETFSDVNELAYFFGRLFALGRGIASPMCNRIAQSKTAALAARVQAVEAERAKHYEANPQYGFL